MPRAYRKDVSCTHCGAAIITDGKLTCPRCHESVDIASSKDVVCDTDGRWKCQKCLEHGKRPKTLAVGDEIQCRVCPEKTKNYLFEKEPEMPKTAAVKTASGATKLTTKEYNALLEKWLKDDKKKKREIEKIPPAIIISPAGERDTVREEERDTIRKEIEATNKRIGAIEKAIALGFDPDEFEKRLNIPLAAHVSPPNRDSRHCSLYFRARIQRYLNSGFIGGPQPLLIKIMIDPLRREVTVDFFEKVLSKHLISIYSDMKNVERISCSYVFGPALEFSKKGRRLRVGLDGSITDVELEIEEE